MLISISDFLRHTAFKMGRDPEELIKIFLILINFLKDRDNFKENLQTFLQSKSIKLPLKLNAEAAGKLKDMLSEYPSVYKSGVSNVPGVSTGEDVNFIYIVGQFLVVVSLNLQSFFGQIELAKIKNKEINTFEKVLNDFFSIWGGASHSNARSLTDLYNNKPTNTVINDLSDKMQKSVTLLKGPFKTVYDRFKEISE